MYPVVGHRVAGALAAFDSLGGRAAGAVWISRRVHRRVHLSQRAPAHAAPRTLSRSMSVTVGSLPGRCRPTST